MEGEGYIRLYWKTKRSLVGDNPVALGLWAHILLSCAVKKQLLRNGLVLEPGECIVNATDLAKKAGVSKTTMSNYIKSMAANGMVSVLKSDRNGTHLSVCNFKGYQPQFFEELPKSCRTGTSTKPQRNLNDTQTENPKSPKNPKGEKFTPPTVDQVAEYIAEKGYQLDAEAFIAGYQRQGWKLKNGRPVTCWKSCLTTWEKNRQKWEREKSEQQKASRPGDVDLRL